jgi:phage baseplate assembly protein W
MFTFKKENLRTGMLSRSPLRSADHLSDDLTLQMLDNIANNRATVDSGYKEAQKAGFLGRGWSFPPTFDANSGTVLMVADAEDIRQSLFVLFSTMQRERVMLPDYGCQLGNYVFDSINSTLFARIKDSLTTSILYYEPRISAVQITMTADDNTGGLLLISLTYTIRQTNTRSNMVYPYYLQGEGNNARSFV